MTGSFVITAQDGRKTHVTALNFDRAVLAWSKENREEEDGPANIEKLAGEPLSDF